MKIKFLLLAVAAIGVSLTANAQHQLTKHEKELWNARIDECVNEFCACVNEISRNPTREETQNMERFRAVKEAKIAETLKLFIGEGKAYTVIEGHWNGSENEEVEILHQPAMVDVLDGNGQMERRLTVESYLRRFLAMGRNVEVKVSGIVTYCASELKMESEGTYELTYYFKTEQVKYDDAGHIQYRDTTTNSVKVIVHGRDSYNPVKIGDIRIIETQRL